MQVDSFCVKEPRDPRTTAPHVLPIYATSSFAFDNIEQGIEIFNNIESGHTYSRYSNPTVDAVAQKIADLETHGLELEATAVMSRKYDVLRSTESAEPFFGEKRLRFSVNIRRDYCSLSVTVATKIRNTSIEFRNCGPRQDAPIEPFDNEATKQREDKFVGEKIDSLLAAMVAASTKLDTLFETSRTLEIVTAGTESFSAAAKFYLQKTLRVSRNSLAEALLAISVEVHDAKARSDVSAAEYQESKRRWKSFAIAHYKLDRKEASSEEEGKSKRAKTESASSE